jgi:carbon monoxide dehydrogenase subunit G
MTTVERTFSVDLAPDAVLGYLKDFANAEEWDPGTEHCVRTDDGPIRVGSTWHNTSKIAGVTTELTYTLDELTADTVVFAGKNDSATTRDTISVRPAGAGSEITYHAEITISGLLGTLAAPATKLLFEKLGHDTERQLTEVLNSRV